MIRLLRKVAFWEATFFVVLCLAPQALTFVLALMKRYPYGGAVRLNLYLAPYMCLTIGYGAAALLAWLAHNRIGPVGGIFSLRPIICQRPYARKNRRSKIPTIWQQSTCPKV